MEAESQAALQVGHGMGNERASTIHALPLGNTGGHGGCGCMQADMVILCERNTVARCNWMQEVGVHVHRWT